MKSQSQNSQKFQWTFTPGTAPDEQKSTTTAETSPTSPSPRKAISSFSSSVLKLSSHPFMFKSVGSSSSRVKNTPPAPQSESEVYKPYARSSLWKPRLEHNEEDSRARFLTLTPLSQKPTKTSLPLISTTPTSSEGSDIRKYSPQFEDHKINILSGHHFRSEPPSSEVKVLTHPCYHDRNEVQHLFGGFHHSDHHSKSQYQHPQKSQYLYENFRQETGQGDLNPFDKLPKINSSIFSLKKRSADIQIIGREPKYISQNIRKPADSKSIFTKTKRGHFGENDNAGPQALNLWRNPNLSRTHTFLKDISDNNLLDEKTLFSNRQTHYYSRITRENSIMPLPMENDRRRHQALPDGTSVLERRYVSENKGDSTRTNLVEKDDVVFPGVYKNLLQKRKSRNTYARSFLAKEKKRSQLRQMTCARCHQLFDIDDHVGLHTVRSTQEKPLPSKGKNKSNVPGPLFNKNVPSQRERGEGNDSNDPSGNEDEKETLLLYRLKRNVDNVTASEEADDASIPSGQAANFSAQFCDVLGKSTCEKCREFYAKQFRTRVEETMKKSDEFLPSTPPSTPGDSGIFIPTQALQKVIIKVKDRQGVTAVTAVKVNEDVTVGL